MTTRIRAGIPEPQTPDDLDEARAFILSRTVRQDGCLVWTGPALHFEEYDYGQIVVGGKRIAVHRVAAWIVLGRPLERSERIGWSCENSLCVSAKHLVINGPARGASRGLLDLRREEQALALARSSLA